MIQQYNFIWSISCIYIFLFKIYIKIIFKWMCACARVRAYIYVMIHNNIIRKYDNLIKFSKWDK